MNLKYEQMAYNFGIDDIVIQLDLGSLSMH